MVIGKNRKLIKVILFTIFIILILGLLRNFNNYRIKHEIINLVKDNEDLLNESVENDTYSVVYELDKVKDIRKWPLDDGEIYIEFFCQGKGIASNSTYIGFYYVSKDKAIGAQGNSYELQSKGKGWQWRESNGDNWYYTEKIADHWYYYEVGL